MAVVSGIAATVGTGMITGGALAVTFAVPQAQAATYEVTPGDDNYMHSCIFTDEADGVTTAGWAAAAANNSVHTLHFVAPETAGDDKVLQIQYNTFSAAAIVADADTDIAGIAPSGTRGFIIGVNGADNTSTFNRDFSFTPNNGFTIRGNNTFNVAVGKTLNIAPTGGTLQSGGALTLAGGGSVVMTRQLVNNGTITISADTSLTLSGLKSTTALVNNGSLEFAAGAVIDLSTLTATDGVYTIFTGSGTSASFAGLTSENLTGVELAGREVAFSADGTVTISLAESTLLFNGGTLSWDTTTASFDSNKTFAEGNSVVFTGVSDVTLAENISAAAVIVAGESTMRLTGGANKLTTASLNVEGTLVLKDAALADETRVIGAGTVEIGYDMTTNKSVLAGLTGNLVVGEGATVIAGASDALGTNLLATSNRVIRVKDGGTLDVHGREEYYAIVLEKGGTLANDGGGISVDDYRQTPIITLEGDATVRATANFGMVGSGYGATTLTLNGHTLTKTGAAEFTLRNTTVSAGTIHVSEGKLKVGYGTASTLNNTVLSVGNGAVLELHGGTYSSVTINLEDGATFNYRTGGDHSIASFNTGTSILSSADNATRMMTVTGASLSTGLLTKKNNGGLTYSGTVNLQKGMTVEAGTVNFNGAATISGLLTVNTGATLNVGESGSVIIGDLSGFSSTTTEPTTNGLASVSYKVLENNGTSNITSVTYSGDGQSYTLTDGAISLADLYYAVSGTVTVGGSSPTADTANAAGYVVKSGATLAIAGNANDTMTAAKIVSTASGNGTLKITTDGFATGNANLTTTFSGTLELAENVGFTFGSATAGNGADSKVIDTSSFSAVKLHNGSTLKYCGNGQSTFNNVTVADGTAALYFVDADHNRAVQLAGTTTLNGNLNITSQYNGALNIHHLTGAGNISSSGPGETYVLSIESLQGYTGAMSFNKGSGPYRVSIGSGTGANVAHGGITIANGTQLTVNVAEGVAMTGAVTVNGAGNTITSAGAGLNLSQLSVGSGAALTLGGNVSALLMNHDGGLTLNGLSLTDGAVLSYGSGANLLSIGADMLTGGVVIAGGLTLDETGVNLGLSSEIAMDSIGIDAYSDGELVKVGGNWYLKTSVVAVPDNVLEVGTDGVTYDSADVTGKNTIRLNGGLLTLGDTDVAAEFTTLETTFAGGSIVATGTESEVSFSSVAIADGATVTLKDGATDLTLKTNSISFGTDSAIVVESGQTLDLSAIDYSATASGFNASGAFEKLVDAASGAGTVKIGSAADAIVQVRNAELNTNLEVANIRLNSHSAGATLTIGENGSLTATGEFVRLENRMNLAVSGGDLTAAKVQLGHSTRGYAAHLSMADGSITTGSIDYTTAGDTGSSFTMTGGTLTITSATGIGAGVQTSISGGTLATDGADWALTGATVGGVAIVGDNTITLNGGTLTGTLDNSAGKLAVAGAIDITSAGYVTTTTPSEYSSSTGNGYVKTNTAYDVATTVGNLTVADGTTWTVNGSADNVSYANGVVTVAGTDWGTKYYINSADETYSTISKTNGEGEALTAVVLNGSGLNLDSALDGVAIEVTKEGQSVVNITSTTTLNSASVSSDAAHQLKLHGAGTYALANGVGTLGDGVVLGDSSSWTGTVQITNVSTGNMSELLSGLTNGAGTVSVANLTGWFNTVDCAANIKLVNGEGTPAISINNGNADAVGGAQRYAVLSGTVSGDGDIKFLAWSSTANRQVNYKFTGEVSGWTGSFINAGQHERTVNIIFEGDTEINASVLNQGNVADCKSVLTIGGASAVTMNGDVDVTKMVLDQATTFSGSVAVSDSITNNGGMTLSNDLTLAGQLGGTGNVTGTNLDLQGAANTAGDITLSGVLTLGTDSVASTLTAGALDITGGITFNKLAESQITADSLGADLGLSISDALLLTQISQSATKSLTLMTVTDLAGHGILLNGGSEYDSADGQYRYTVSIGADGAVTITSAANGLKWAGTEESNLWGEGDSWLSGSVPEATNSVVFNGAGVSEVIISGSVAIENVTVDVDAANGDTTGYEFIGSSAADELHLSKNLSVNAGSLILGVNTVVDGRTEVVAGASLEVIAGNLASQYGFDNAGELIITSGANQSVVSVVGGDMNNSGTITNSGMLIVGQEFQTEGDIPSLNNSGHIDNTGTIGLVGDLVNSGTLAQTGGSLIVQGDATNTGADIAAPAEGAEPAPGMDISGGAVAITGTLTNTDTVKVSGDDTTVTVGSLVNTDGTLSVESGSVTVGSEETPGTLDNSNGSIALGGESTTGSLTVYGDLNNAGGSISVAGGSDMAVSGDVDNTAGGSISVTGGSSLAVSGNLDNTGGDLSLSDSDSTASIGGDLIMTDGTSKGTLTVGEGTELTVGGDLAANSVTLEFGGNVTVAGDVEIESLTNDGIFTANGSVDTEVHIGTLSNNGTLSVGVTGADGTLTGGHLDITTLTGDGDVNVGEGGSLTINSATTFTGQLNNLGTLDITEVTLDSAQESEGQTAGNIHTGSLVVTDNATGYEGGSYALGEVTTDTLTIDGISTDTTRLSLTSLDSKTEGGKIKLVLSDIEDGTVTDGSYHLIDLEEAMTGSIAEEFDLSNYGYNADGDYDRTLAEVQNDYMQALLQQNKYVTFSDVAPADGVALLAGGTTDLYVSITELPDELSVWNLNGTETMTEAGLTVLTDGKLVSDDILDNVKTVKVTGEQAIDLTGDITRVTLNNLTAAEGSATALTISGDGSADDSAAITTAADGFDGTLVLTKASADISGKVTTLQTGDDSSANLGLTDSAIEVTGTGVTLSGVVNKGSLNFGLGSDELGKEIIGGDVRLNGTAINVTQQDNSIVIDGVGAGVNTIADLGETSGSATVTLNGKGFDKYFSNARLEGGNVVADRNDSYVTDKLAPTSPNGAAGAELLDATLVYDNPQAMRDVMPDRAALLDAVDAGRVSDENLAAVAGSSIATMGMALSGDVERQLRAIRNRTTSMGVNECVVNEGMPYFNAWVNAEGNRSDLDKDGTLAGYTVDSWGGTVGFDVDFDPHFTAGLAITAMYGDLTASGPETKAEGDMDTYYVTLFARYAKSAWTHTFVGTIGLMDGSFDRTVNIGGANYQTEGDTDGMSFGLMYEVGYVMPLDEDATACLQPIFNVMLRHAGVGSYTEKGSDAALDVDSQSVTTLTFGLGARLQAVVGESLYNRASIFEARALVKADVGDRSSEVDVAFVGSSHTATVESAELGAVGVELGAGLTIPVGDDDGSIFIDGAVELRSGYTNVNGTVGYRINF